MKRGSLSDVNSIGDCDKATQSERWWSFPMTALHVISISMVIYIVKIDMIFDVNLL